MSRLLALGLRWLIHRMYGDRCNEHYNSCPCCQAWRCYDYLFGDEYKLYDDWPCAHCGAWIQPYNDYCNDACREAHRPTVTTPGVPEHVSTPEGVKE